MSRAPTGLAGERGIHIGLEDDRNAQCRAKRSDNIAIAPPRFRSGGDAAALQIDGAKGTNSQRLKIRTTLALKKLKATSDGFVGR